MGHTLLAIAFYISFVLTIIVALFEAAIILARMKLGVCSSIRDYIMVRDVYIFAGLAITTATLYIWAMTSEQSGQGPPPPQPSPTPATAPTAAPTPIAITAVVAYPSRPGWYELHRPVPSPGPLRARATNRLQPQLGAVKGFSGRRAQQSPISHFRQDNPPGMSFPVHRRSPGIQVRPL